MWVKVASRVSLWSCALWKAGLPLQVHAADLMVELGQVQAGLAVYSRRRRQLL